MNTYLKKKHWKHKNWPFKKTFKYHSCLYFTFQDPGRVEMNNNKQLLIDNTSSVDKQT